MTSMTRPAFETRSSPTPASAQWRLPTLLLAAVLAAALAVAPEARAQQPDEEQAVVLPADSSSISQSVVLQGGEPDGVPIGYGLRRSVDGLTGSVGFNEAKEIQNRAVLNPSNALYGRVLGLTVLQNNGLPPTTPTFFVRGRETFSSSEPLVLVDDFQRPISSLSPEEIESVSVLKDAASLAMYGQRGANGVILVKTKRGYEGDLRVNGSVQQAVTQPHSMPSFVDAPTYARAINEALSNDGRDLRYSDAELQRFENGGSAFYPNVDWFDRVLRDYGKQTSINLTFEGGDERARYFAMMNYAGEQGIFGPVNKNEDFNTQASHNRFNFRGNLDVDVTDDLLLRVNLAGNIAGNNLPSAGGGTAQIFDALYSTPSAAFPVRTPSGAFGGTQIYNVNPVATLTSTGYGSPNSRDVSGDVILQQDLGVLTEGLSAEAMVSYNSFSSFFESDTRSYSYEQISPVFDDAGTIVDTTTSTFGQDTDLSFGSQFGEQRTSRNAVGKLQFDRTFGENDVDATVLFHQSTRVMDGQDNEFRRRNFAANVHYGYAGKYFLNAVASYNGNNILPEGSRYGFFPAVSAAWLISEEGFMEATDGFLNRLKLRASTGLSGSDRLPTDNIYEQSFSGAPGYWMRNNNVFRPGFAERALATDDFTYETSYKADVGVDARLFDGLDMTLNAFYGRRTDILTNSGGRTSEVIGIAPPQATNGIVENRGFEAALGWEQDVGDDFSYQIGGQFALAQNEIVENDEPFRPEDYLQRKGEAVGQWFGLEAVGFFEDEEEIANSPEQVFGDVQPGDVKYKDQNGDGIINEFDEVPIGHANGYPEMNFSATLRANYKGFSVSALMQGTGNYTAYLNTQSVFWPLQNDNTISDYYYERRWTPETAESASFPRLTSEENNNNFRPSSLWLRDQSYAKLRSLTVSYALPGSLVQSLSMQNMSLYLQGENLFSIDSIPVLDPEHLDAGYPLLRSYSLGLSLRF